MKMDQDLVDEVSIVLNSLTRFIHEDFDGEAKVAKLPIFRVSQIALHSSRFGSFFTVNRNPERDCTEEVQWPIQYTR